MPSSHPLLPAFNHSTDADGPRPPHPHARPARCALRLFGSRRACHLRRLRVRALPSDDGAPPSHARAALLFASRIGARGRALRVELVHHGGEPGGQPASLAASAVGRRPSAPQQGVSAPPPSPLTASFVDTPSACWTASRTSASGSSLLAHPPARYGTYDTPAFTI